MRVMTIKTKPIKANDDLWQFLDESIRQIQPNCVLAVTSKIIALCEGRIADPKKIHREDLVPQEAEYYLPSKYNKYGFTLSIKNHTLIASAGIDESNANGNYVLWPKNPQTSANQIRQWLVNKFKINHLGVIITDSHVLPLRWGTHGTCLAYSGFKALNNYVGQPDIFGRPLQVTRANVAEGLAAAAVLCMGEGNEQTPLAIISDINFVQFQDRNPTQAELASLKIELKDDVYAPILQAANWQKGQGDR